jgi:selenophosphate synthase
VERVRQKGSFKDTRLTDGIRKESKTDTSPKTGTCVTGITRYARHRKNADLQRKAASSGTITASSLFLPQR